MNKLLLEQIICSNYIRFDKLRELITINFSGRSEDNIDIYIDLNSLLKDLYSNIYDIDDYSTVTSCIINMCAHYRYFFMSRFNCTTTFFIIYSDNLSEFSTKLVPEYNIAYKEKITNNGKVYSMIKTNMDLLHTLAVSLPDIYFLRTTFETAVLIHDLVINETRPNTTHIVISKDLYTWLLPSINSNISILRPKKYQGNDESFCITWFNLCDNFYKQRKVKSYGNFYQPMFSMILALSKLPERSLKSKFNINVAVDRIMNIDQHKRLEEYDIDIQHRYKVIDIPFQHQLFKMSPEPNSVKLELKTQDHRYRNFNVNELKFINDKYFINNPLDLNRL